MTFYEWARTINPLHEESDDNMETRLWRQCWEAATRSEREACVGVCLAVREQAVMGGNDSYLEGRQMGAAVCMNKIRIR